MKIVMLSRLFDPHAGGVEKHTEHIAIEAIKDGHEVTVVTSQHEESLSYKSRLLHGATEDYHDGVLIYRIPKLYEDDKKSFFSKLLERIRVWEWMIWNVSLFLRADIIHIHDVFWWYWPIRLLLPFKKVFITFHGFEPSSVKTTEGQGQVVTVNSKAKKARWLAERLTKGNICVGAWIQKWYGTTATFTTYGAADCTATKQKSRRSGISNTIFVGRLQQDTGILSYIDAVKKMKGIHLDVVGDGPLRKEIEKKIHGDKRFRLMGKSDNTCVLYPQYDIACVSSYLSMIEALQCEVPVIAFSTDELKHDYLESFPVAHDITIVGSNEELERALTTTKKEIKGKRAFLWAKKQTWKKVYLLYNKLWMKQ